jgi:hypothetical protein
MNTKVAIGIKTTIQIEYWLNANIRDVAKNGETATPTSTDIIKADAVFSDIPTAYTYLKTLSAFSTATDC